MSVEELKAQIATAIANGDDAGLMTAIKELNKFKAEIAKAEQEKARKEAEALAGAREKLATAIHKAVNKIPNIVENLQAVKATGFTFKLDNTEEGITYKSVALAVPQVKAHRTGGGGGKGQTKEQYGMSMQEIVANFGTAEEQAEAEALRVKGREDRADSKLYLLQKAIRKRAIAEGKLQPVK